MIRGRLKKTQKVL